MHRHTKAARWLLGQRIMGTSSLSIFWWGRDGLEKGDETKMAKKLECKQGYSVWYISVIHSHQCIKSQGML